MQLADVPELRLHGETGPVRLLDYAAGQLDLLLIAHAISVEQYGGASGADGPSHCLRFPYVVYMDGNGDRSALGDRLRHGHQALEVGVNEMRFVDGERERNAALDRGCHR